MEELRRLVDDFVEYTKTWSISEEEWYWNVNNCRKTQDYGEKTISPKEFEKAIREDILYCFIYNIDSIREQMQEDLSYGYESARFDEESRQMEERIQKLFKDFKIYR